MYELWLGMWEYFFNHPVGFLLIAVGICLAVYLIYLSGLALIRYIRFRRWANRQVWYINGSGDLYRKDRTKDYERREYR